MTPSTWNDTNQHWIPQFLLKGFGIRGKARQVYELDKETNSIVVRKVKEAASKKHLLTDRDDDLMRGIERRATEAIDAVRGGRVNRINEEDRQAIDKLVCAMMVNDPYSRFDAEETRNRTITEFSSKLSETARKFRGRLDETDLRDFFDERLNHDFLSIFMHLESNRVLLALSLMGLQVSQSADGEFFIIGDSPVLAIRGAMNGGTSLLNPGSQVILPVSSRCILVYTWETAMNVIEEGGKCDKEQVRLLNSDYYHATKSRYIYGRDEETLKRSRLLQMQWTPRERSNEVNNGWAMMQYLGQIRQEQLETQKAVLDRRRDDGARELVALAIAQSEYTPSANDDQHQAAQA